MSLSVNGGRAWPKVHVYFVVLLWCVNGCLGCRSPRLCQLWLGIRNDSTLRWTLAFSLIFTAFLLRRRGTSFELRALTVPFSVAIAELLAPMLREQPKSQEE